MKSGQRPCTIVQGLLPDFGATLKIHKKSNFDQNQLTLSIQHKYMYMYEVSQSSGITLLIHTSRHTIHSTCTIHNNDSLHFM